MQANFSFKLKDPKSEKETLIYLVSYFNGHRFKYSTGLKISPKFWLTETQTATLEGLKGKPETKDRHRVINRSLNRLKLNFEKALHNCTVNDTTPTPEDLKAKLDEIEPRKSPKNAANNIVTEFIKSYILEAKLGQRLTLNGKKLSPLTLKSYGATLTVLGRFEKQRNSKLSFDEINGLFYRQFLEFCNKSNFTPNYTGTHIKNLKLFCRAALNLKLTENRYFQEKEFKKIEQTGTKVYLSVSEIERIYNLEPKSKKLENAKDLFVIAVWTGLRVSDLRQLRPEHFNLIENVIKINTIKTNQAVTIPLHWQVLEIFKKYENRLPRAISDQKLNDYIKEICEEAQINELTQVTEFKGGLRYDSFKPKHELITAHTARRSFATNCYLAGIPAISIMRITGHKTEAAFLKYIKISNEENALLVSQNKLFSPLRIAK